MALSSNALCTLQQLKNRLDISDDREDSSLEELIEAASESIRQYLGYDPVEADYTDEPHWLYNDKVIWTKHIPVNSISSLVDEEGNTIDSENYSNKTYYIELEYRYFGEIKVSYNAGYDPVPFVIGLTAIRIASLWHSEKTRGIGVQSASNDFGGMNYFDTTTKKLLEEISGYRKVD